MDTDTAVLGGAVAAFLSGMGDHGLAQYINGQLRMSCRTATYHQFVLGLVSSCSHVRVEHKQRKQTTEVDGLNESVFFGCDSLGVLRFG